MANTAQAKKRARQALAANKRNSMLTSRFRTTVKSLLKKIKAGSKQEALEFFPHVQKIIDITAGKKIIHKNKAARHKSRLSALVKAMV